MKIFSILHTGKASFMIACLLCFARMTSAEVTLLESNPLGLTLSYRPALSQEDSLFVDNKVYHVFTYHGHSYGDKPGIPMIPLKKIFFAAPEGTTPSVEISDVTVSTRSDITLAPNPSVTSDGNGFTSMLFEEDPTSYAMSGYYPAGFVSLGNNIVIDGVAVWELHLNPLIFDARISSIASADSFDVAISFNGQQLINATGSRQIPGYIINMETVDESAGTVIVQKRTDFYEDPFADGEWYRITLTDNGLYRITGSQLKNAGFPSGSVSSNEINMLYGGGRTLEIEPHELSADDFREIAITVRDGGDGVFDDNDEIIFYGQALSRFITESGTKRPEFQNYPYADIGAGINVYWLVITSDGIPKRMGSTGEIPTEDITAKTTFRELIHIEPENYLEWLDKHDVESGTQWYWAAVSQETEQFSFDAPGYVSGDSVKVRISFLNGKNQKDVIYSDHDLGIKVNNEGPFSRSLDTDENVSQRYVDIVLSEAIKTAKNSVTIRRTNGTSDENVRLDWLELEYERELKLSNNTIEFFQTGSISPFKCTVSNATDPSIEIYDTTDPFNVKNVINTLYNGTNKTATYQTDIPPGTMHNYSISSHDEYLNVTSITKKTPAKLRNSNNGADYVVISNKQFLQQAEKLADWRSRDSRIDPLTTMVVDVDDIYDEFGWGVFDPSAIRDFLKFAHENYNPPIQYCCFLGDTTFKYKNLSENQIGKNFIPTYTTVEMLSGSNGLSTDDYFTWFDSYRIPEIALGRLCAFDNESAEILVDKIIDYERTPESGLWHNRIMLIADDELTTQGLVESSNKRFTENIESIDLNYIPQSFDRKKILMIEYPLNNLKKPAATEDLLTSIQNGYLIVNYIGHGNNDVLAHEHILRGSRDIEKFNNDSRQPLFLIFSCAVGQFDKPEVASLAEMLNLRKNGGAIAVIAASRVTTNYYNVLLNQEFYHYLFDREENPDHRIGLALKKGKIDADYDNSSRYVLFGDPATRLMCARYDFNLAKVDTLYRKQKVDINGSISENSIIIPYDGTLKTRAYGPRIHKEYMFMYNNIENKIAYSMPGKLFFNGELDISGDSFTSSFVVPVDLQSDISKSKDYQKESKILFFASGETDEASGILSGYYIGGIAPDAPEDNNGPEITLAFDGKTFSEGDFIRRQPILTAELQDDSGINILGNRGHNIQLLINKTDATVLTDRFRTVNGYTNGMLEFELPVLSSGEHTFEFTAYDSFNNASKMSISAQIIGSETGEVTITNPLNYPNPMGFDGTTFTFGLNDDIRYGDIQVYSQSGRRVDTVKFNAEYGFNTVEWTPPVQLANGVYFYKITVVSFNGRKTSKIEKLVVMK